MKVQDMTHLYLNAEIERLRTEIRNMNLRFKNVSTELAEIAISESRNKESIIRIITNYIKVLTEINDHIQKAEMELTANKIALQKLERRKQ